MFRLRVLPLLHALLFSGLRHAMPAGRGRSLLIGGLVLASAAAASAAAPSPRLFLEIDMAVERGTTAAIFFDFGDGIWPENSSAAEVAAGPTPRTLRLALPSRPIRGLRFDPTADDQPVLISAMRVADEQGRVVRTLDLALLRPMNQIDAIVPEAGGVRVRPLPKADDPMLRIDLGGLQQGQHEALGWRTVNRGSIALLGLLLAALVVIAVVTAVKSARGANAWLAGAAIFCTVFGARLLWLNLFSRAVPFWDEWEGDALYILIPFAGGVLDWNALIMPQWEHRILLTRTITLFGTVLNGEWDPRVAMTVSAAMFAATTALLGSMLLATRHRAGLLAAAILTIAAALPYDFNNLLWGGQTQMYALVLLAVCAIAMAATPRVTGATWIAAGGAGLVSLFTMGAGPVAPGCAVGICLLRGWYEREQRRRLLGLAAVFFVVALVGVCLHVSSRAHLGFYATNVTQFRRAFTGILAWPLPAWIGWAVLAWVPCVANVVGLLRRREATALEWLAAGLTGWAAIDAVALGYARQYEGPPFDSRFFTPISVGAWASLTSSAALFTRLREWRNAIWPLVALVVVGGGLLVSGLAGIKGAHDSRADRQDRENRVRGFLATGNRTLVMEKPTHFTGEPVLDRLDSPLLQPILPAAFRRELAARPGHSAFAAAQPGPVTTVVRSLMKLGPLLALLGVAAFFFHAWRSRPWVRLLPVGPSRIPAGVSPAGVWRRVAALSRDEKIDRGCYLAAVCITLGWFAVYNHVRRDGLVDEPGHYGDILHFLAGQPGWPESMPMLPGYHFIVVSLMKLLPALSVETASRSVTTALTLLGLACFALAWRRLHGAPAARATLLLALLPLAQPFAAMAYTDWPALAFLFAAAWAHVTGRRALAVIALAAATLIRQTNLIWAGFFVGWELLRTGEPLRVRVARLGWWCAFLAAAAVTILWAGRLTLGSQHGNEFRFNVASVHFGALLVLVLGLPVWVAHAPATWRAWRETARSEPRKVVGWASGAALAVVLGAATFANPHIWNRELFWEGCTFTLLRNWPLVWIDSHPWLRVVSSVNIVLMAVALVRTLRVQRHARALWLVLVVGAVPVVTNSLVEPRYFIPLAGMLLCFLQVDAANWRRLLVWWGLLSAVHAPFVARALSLW